MKLVEYLMRTDVKAALLELTGDQQSPLLSNIDKIIEQVPGKLARMWLYAPRSHMFLDIRLDRLNIIIQEDDGTLSEMYLTFTMSDHRFHRTRDVQEAIVRHVGVDVDVDVVLVNLSSPLGAPDSRQISLRCREHETKARR